MDDHEILTTIQRLVDEEHTLEHEHTSGGGLQGDDATRFEALQVQLDQCWDLLRQRRARRNAGQDPDQAAARPGRTVEGYLQ